MYYVLSKFLKYFANMGNSNSSDYLDKLPTSDESDSDDYKDCTVKSIPTKLESGVNLTTDAAPRQPITLPPPETKLSVKKLEEIENELDEDEIVSMVYLLFDDNFYAIQELSLRLQHSSRRVLTEWARLQESKGICWQRNVIEALFVIQNYKILRQLGYSKDLAAFHYLPHQPNTTLHIKKMRKLCYILCEKMNNEKTSQFIDLVKKDMSLKGQTFSTHYNYLEINFLEMENYKYITPGNMSNLKKILKAMGQEGLYCMIEDNVTDRRENIHEEEPQLQTAKVIQMDTDPTKIIDDNSLQSSGNFSFPQSVGYSLSNQKVSTTMDNQNNPIRDLSFDEQCISSSLHTPNVIGIEKYEINPDRPGVVLIINEENFFREFEEKYKHLLPTDANYRLERRYGSTKDRDALENTFEKFGFRVIVENNLLHNEIISKIKTVLEGITDASSLFICILSHGDEGIVYGSNSCKVKVTTIQKLMYKTNKTNLLGKPKFLILQSCQGQQCQKVKENISGDQDTSDSDSDEFTIDNGGNTNRQSLPKTADMFTFWATVPGYAAVRHKKMGSWFIQSFCEQMENLGNRAHFADICTNVIREVTEKKWKTPEGNNVTTPMIDSTLRKFFYLPPMRN